MISIRDSERSLHICGILPVDSAWKLFVYSVSKKSYSNLAKPNKNKIVLLKFIGKKIKAIMFLYYIFFKRIVKLSNGEWWYQIWYSGRKIILENRIMTISLDYRSDHGNFDLHVCTFQENFVFSLICYLKEMY